MNRVRRTKTLDVAALSEAEKRQWAAQLLDIYRESMDGLTDEAFFDDVFGSKETRLRLFYGSGDTLVGFAFARIDRLDHEGDRCAVFSGGVSFRLACKGGGLATAIFGLSESIRFKLREPSTQVAYFTRASSPAAYRILPTTMPAVFPHPDVATPPVVQRRVLELSRRRGYRPVADDPWVVRSSAVPRKPEKFKNLEGDRLARYFLEQNPDYAKGAALLVWTRLDASDIVRGLAKVAYLRLKTPSRRATGVRATR